MRVWESDLGSIVAQHYDSLPVWEDSKERLWPWPWVATFLGLPALGAVGLSSVGLAESSSISGGLLAGVGVLGGFLFQVLTIVASRIAAVADDKSPEALTNDQLDLVTALDDVRANIAYGALVSVVLVVELGLVSLLKAPPNWLSWLSVYLLFHFATTLALVLVRINKLGRNDRILAVTKHARARPRAGRRAA